MTDEPLAPATLPSLGPGTWIWSSQAPPPISGQVRSDSRNWTGASLLSIDRHGDDGTDASASLAAIKSGDVLRLEHNTDPNRWARYEALATPVRVVDCFQTSVAYSAGAGMLPNSGTRINVMLFPNTAPVGEVVVLSMVRSSSGVWIGNASCKHGKTNVTIYGSATAINPAQMVYSTYRQHELIVACNCPHEAPKLNATVTYAPQLGVAPGERRLSIEQTGTLAPGQQNLSFPGRLICLRDGAYHIDASIKLGTSVASGARGLGQVFVAGTPAMITAPLADEGGVATAIITGTVNLTSNQPLAIAYVNQGTGNQDVTATTLTVSEVWVP